MIVSKQQWSDISEIPLDINPGKTFSDAIPARVRVWWKKNIFYIRHHNTIIPETAYHSAWVLGAQPDEETVRKIYQEQQNNRKIHIVSMLHADEIVMQETEIEKLKQDGILSQIDRNPWFDHGTLNTLTGRNQTVQDWRKFLSLFYEREEKGPNEKMFYCHCMAGKSRSLILTMSFLYFHPDKKSLFDFDNWPQNFVAEIDSKSPGLKDRLRDNPSFSDIAEFVKIQRASVKYLWDTDGDQSGFLGLLMLDEQARNSSIITTRNKERLCQDAQNIGLMLAAPLGLVFRNQEDRKRQEENLASVCLAYERRGINLLMTMLVPLTEQIKKPIADLDEFTKRFKKLTPNAQARFALLLRKLEEEHPEVNLGSLRGRSLEYAQLATEHLAEITASDQIELFRSFELASDSEYLVGKILDGDGNDKYEGVKQLMALLEITGRRVEYRPAFIEAIVNRLTICRDPQFAIIREFLKQPDSQGFAEEVLYYYFTVAKNAILQNKLSYNKQLMFLKRLVDLGDSRVIELAKRLQTNYTQRDMLKGFLSHKQVVFLEKLSTGDISMPPRISPSPRDQWKRFVGMPRPVESKNLKKASINPNRFNITSESASQDNNGPTFRR